MKENVVILFAIDIAREDAATCVKAATVFDPEWTGEHATGLADALGVPFAELLDEDVHAARVAYEHEAKRILRGEP